MGRGGTSIYTRTERHFKDMEVGPQSTRFRHRMEAEAVPGRARINKRGTYTSWKETLKN